ncbi:phosphotransferase [Shewanella submarina]|nr:phosphotransferase [Shewanella submarina]MCL1037313.1 phosphotransferase [Shewanella submarina]
MAGIIKQFFSKSHEMTLSDPRFLCLHQWLQQELAADFSIELISGDASFRRYFRVVTAKNTLIAVDSPPELVPIKPFVDMDLAFADAGLSVPAIIATDEAQGLMLLEDLGDTQLGMLLTRDNAADWYQQALDLLPAVYRVTEAGAKALPDYDAAFVQRELDIFNEWLLQAHLQLDHVPHELLQSCFDLLITSAMEQPQGGMHRDYHSRNLMVKDNQLMVIDFQDAVCGPISYDPVSLLRDCYVRWDDELVSELRQYYFSLLRQQGMLEAEVSEQQFSRWFDLMGLQRHIKAAGIFARLHHRDGKSGYLKDIPLTLTYIVDIARRYPELQELGDWVEAVVVAELDKKGQL